MNTTLDPDRLWFDTVDEVKRRIIAPSFWQALEAVVPIMLENNTLVVGLPAAMSFHGSMVNSTENRHRVQVILSELAGQPLDLRVIEGTDPEDWEMVKRREAIGREAELRVQARRERAPGVEDTWEGLMDMVVRMYQRQPLRQLPQKRAEYLRAVLPIIAGSVEKLASGMDPDEESIQRPLSRVLERVANLVEVPAVWIAYELAALPPAKDA